MRIATALILAIISLLSLELFLPNPVHLASQSEKITCAQQISVEKDFQVNLRTPGINLPAKKTEDLYGQDALAKSVCLEFKKDVWITEIIPQIINGPAELLHHGEILYKNQKDDQCKTDKMFYTYAKEQVRFKIPEGYGYFIPKGTLVYSAPSGLHFRNDTQTSFRDVSYTINLKGTADSSRKLNKLEIFWLNVECSEEKELIFPLPPKQKYQLSLKEQYVAPIDFKIIMFGGHLHDFGRKLDFKINGQINATLIPETDNLGRVLSMPIFYFDKDPIIIKRGDSLDIEVTYDNPTDKIQEGMGIFGALIQR